MGWLSGVIWARLPSRRLLYKFTDLLLRLHENKAFGKITSPWHHFLHLKYLCLAKACFWTSFLNTVQSILPSMSCWSFTHPLQFRSLQGCNKRCFTSAHRVAVASLSPTQGAIWTYQGFCTTSRWKNSNTHLGSFFSNDSGHTFDQSQWLTTKVLLALP